MPFVVGVLVLVVLTVALGVFVRRAVAGAPARAHRAGPGCCSASPAGRSWSTSYCPVLFPLVVDKGFPPRWYGVAVYGVALGALVALLPPPGTSGPAPVAAGPRSPPCRRSPPARRSPPRRPWRSTGPRSRNASSSGHSGWARVADSPRPVPPRLAPPRLERVSAVHTLRDRADSLRVCSLTMAAVGQRGTGRWPHRERRRKTERGAVC